jgi:hypothetical protein
MARRQAIREELAADGPEGRDGGGRGVAGRGVAGRGVAGSDGGATAGLCAAVVGRTRTRLWQAGLRRRSRLRRLGACRLAGIICRPNLEWPRHTS